jgi:trimethylamine---corrinoid protein Co-methyltransferase
MERMRLRVLDQEGCVRLHDATLNVLERTGVEIWHEAARERCVQAGATADGRRVRLPRALVAEALCSASRSAVLPPRGGDTGPLELAAGHGPYFGTGPDCMFVRDPGTGERRRGRLDDVTAAAALAEQLANIDFVMSMALPEDVDPDVLDTTQLAAMLTATRKPIVASSPFGGEQLRVMHEMAATCGEARSLACLAMTSPPLILDDICCDKAIACAELGVPLVLAGSPSAGATAPASLPAVVVVANAELLAGLVVHQLAGPGAVFVYGAGVGAINLRTFVDVYGAPSVFAGDQAMLDLAAWYGLPSWSYAGHSDSKLLDEQWALEMGIATNLGALSGATLLHDVGYLESGMQSSLEALVLGDELAGYARATLCDLTLDDASLALDEIDVVGPGGNHLARRLTRERHRSFWHPSLIDQQTFEQWRAGGGETLLERVRTRLLELQAASPAFRLDSDAAAAVAQLAERDVR